MTREDIISTFEQLEIPRLASGSPTLDLFRQDEWNFALHDGGLLTVHHVPTPYGPWRVRETRDVADLQHHELVDIISTYKYPAP